MELSVSHPEFQQQKLVVRTEGFFKGPTLLLNGVEQKKVKGYYHVENDSGSQIKIRLKLHLVDPVPAISVSGEILRLARPLTKLEYVWIALPVILVTTGGALGGMIGGMCAVLNSRIMRSQRSPVFRYGLTAVITAGSYGVFLVVLSGLNTLSG